MRSWLLPATSSLFNGNQSTSAPSLWGIRQVLKALLRISVAGNTRLYKRTCFMLPAKPPVAAPMIKSAALLLLIFNGTVTDLNVKLNSVVPAAISAGVNAGELAGV